MADGHLDDGASADESIKQDSSAGETKANELEFENSVELQVSKSRVWECISDPEILARCVPGAESVTRESPNRYAVDLTRGVSSLTVNLSGEVELLEVNEPEWLLASGSAYDDRSHTEVDGLAAIELTRIDRGAVRGDYRVSMTFTGGLASVPNRIVASIVKRDVAAYFENIAALVDE